LALLGYAAFAAVTFRAARFGLVAIILCIPIAFAVERWQLRRAASAFRNAYASSGKDLLIVYSASPHWQPYIDRNWIARWQDRVVVLNRSAPDWQARPETPLWRHLTGSSNHTPVAIIVPARGRPSLVRFYSAFQDFKHGKVAALHAQEQALEKALLGSVRGDV
jgi:hypothetical protein